MHRAPFAIARVRTVRLDVPMRKAFGISGGTQALAQNVLVSVELGSGIVGFGEAAPLPAFNGETQEATLSALDRASPTLTGADVRAWRGLAERIRGATMEGSPKSAAAACALETAAMDAFARQLGTSLATFFGGAETELVTDVTITTGTVEEASSEARAFAPFSTLKIKIGGDHVDRDGARILAVRAARPDAQILLDANGGLTFDEAIYLAAELGRRGERPALFEQPIAPGDLAAMAEIRAKTGLVIALDESVTCPADVIDAHRARATDAINIKLMKSGIAGALDIASATRACGMTLMIGGMVETRLAMGTSACLAAGLGGFAFVDLDTPLFLAEDPFEGGYAQDGARLDLRPIAAGHGATPRRAL